MKISKQFNKINENMCLGLIGGLLLYILDYVANFINHLMMNDLYSFFIKNIGSTLLFLICSALVIYFNSSSFNKRCLKNESEETKESVLNESYKIVYDDLCSKHSHVMSFYNGTLDPNDIRPQSWKIHKLMQYIIEQGKNRKYDV